MNKLLLFGAIILFMVQISTQKCTQGGRMCKSCEELVFCSDDGDGNWIEEHVDTCKKEIGEYCYHSNMTGIEAECNTNASPFCDGTTDIPFICPPLTMGMFPDPFFCEKFHMCTGAEHIEGTCDAGWSYNARSTYCDMRVDYNPHCYDKTMLEMLPVPYCTEEGQNEAVMDNPTLWYLCIPTADPAGVDHLYPRQHMCKYGGYYEDGQCIHML